MAAILGTGAEIVVTGQQAVMKVEQLNPLMVNYAMNALEKITMELAVDNLFFLFLFFRDLKRD